MSTLPERLKKSRESKGYTQVYVNKQTGINNKTLSGYENGVSEPDLETLQTLANLYEVPLSWLIDDKEKQEEKLKKSFETIRELRDRILRGEILDVDRQPMSKERREFLARQIELEILASEQQK